MINKQAYRKTLRQLLFLAGILLNASCKNDLEKVNLITQKQLLPIEAAKNIEVLYSDSTIVRIKVMAPQMNKYVSDDPYLELPKGVEVLFYNEESNITSKLTSNYAIHYQKKDIMEAKNNVIVINEKGEQLNTEHLIWDSRKEKLYSDVFVKITTPDEIIYGNGFEANQNFTKYKIRNIKGTISVDKNQGEPD